MWASAIQMTVGSFGSKGAARIFRWDSIRIVGMGKEAIRI